MSPDTAKLQFDLYADADFAVLFIIEDIHDPTLVTSRSGLIMNFGSVPIFCISKLQSEITLSTLEIEYIALSQDMRGLVAARNLVLELKDPKHLDLNGMGVFSKAW